MRKGPSITPIRHLLFHLFFFRLFSKGCIFFSFSGQMTYFESSNLRELITLTSISSFFFCGLEIFNRTLWVFNL